ncbi:MAG: hypothetical protein HC817_07695 [Saprospiraceae bacterium]|nr:hypothetical protein [Saprospiraceae bacterium]
MAFLVLFANCQKEDILNADKISGINYAGQVNKIETLGYYSKAEAVTILGLADLPGKVETSCGFYLYRVTYKTKNWNNTDIWVSGLLSVPDTKDIKGLVSYQHGTNPDRNNTASKPTPLEGLGLSSLFAGNGYVLVAPDYIGLGTSQEIHPYALADNS